MLRITEIFYSLQGESIRVGLPTVFIRLTGCPLRCQYCDTTYAFKGGKKLSLTEILDSVAKFQCKYVCVTGGEPLAQAMSLELLTVLCDAGYQVSLETSGALCIKKVDPRVMVVMDLKTPHSKECDNNLWSNLAELTVDDQIKFVLCNRQDYDWAKDVLNTHVFAASVLFSPSFGQLDPTQLAEWILADKLPVRLQLQVHKYLWQDAPGH